MSSESPTLPASEAAPTSAPTPTSTAVAPSGPTPNSAVATVIPATATKMVRENRDYRVGLVVQDQDGVEWKITDMVTRPGATGYRTRVFTLQRVGGTDTKRATARGLTLYSMGTRVDAPAAAALPRRESKEVEASANDDKTKGLIRHYDHEALLRAVRSRANVWLMGPKGSSKSTAALCVASDLGLRFASMSVCKDTTAGQLVGYMTATGHYSTTALRECFEHGGVFLLDEVDAGNATVLLVLNNLLANDYVTFPDGRLVKKHKDFIVIAAANTLGNGPESGYVGRNAIDEATKDRFVLLNWGYDRAIAAAMAKVPVECFAMMPVSKPIRFEKVLPSEEVLQERCIIYTTFVAKVMAAITKAAKGEPTLMRFMPSPRAGDLGSRLIREGFSVADAYEIALWKGLAATNRAKIEAAVASMP